MTYAQAAQYLVEEVHRQTQNLDPKIQALSDRVHLQIFSVPSLMSWLAASSVVMLPDGKARIQLDFNRLPQEAIPDLERLLSLSRYKKHKMLKYIKNGQARTGVEITLSPDDLPGDAYDYTF